jgi:hypothetical protein
VDHVLINEKGNVEEGDHFLHSMAKEEEKGRLKYWESLVGENHVVLHNTKKYGE